jgi:hypothetical protein
MDDDPFFEEAIVRRPTNTAKASPARSLTKWELQQEDLANLTDFFRDIGQEDSLPLFTERGWTYEKLKVAHEADILNCGIPKRVGEAVILGLKKLPGTRLGMAAKKKESTKEESAKKKVINMDLKQEMDFEHVPTADLPPLPKEAPPVTSRVEYKNYMRLASLVSPFFSCCLVTKKKKKKKKKKRYEMQKRGLLEDQVGFFLLDHLGF